MDLQTLTVEEVLQIHAILVEDFGRSGDPIYPPGVKSLDLLGSAVARQCTGLGEVLKYSEPVDNAATLLYGLCCDHPFHNGNKRTALVAMLVHLDKNKLTLHDTRQKELFDLMIAVAKHEIGLPRGTKRRSSRRRRRSPDKEVDAIAAWLRRRSERVRRGEKQVTYRELRKVLERFDYSLQHPKKNTIDIVKFEEATTGLIRRKRVPVEKRIGSIAYPGDNRIVAMRDLKQVRRICRLTEEDGCDTDAFYHKAAIVDGFVNRYRTILRRLANR